MSTTVESAIAALPLPEDWQWHVSVRPRRRTLGIEVTEDGVVHFAVPADAEPTEVAEAVRSRLPRLAAEIRRRGHRPGSPVKELVDGASFAYLGRRYRLRVLAQGTSGHVRLRHGWLELPWTATRHEGARLLADWYAAKGTAWLTARTVPLAARAGVTPRGIEAADLGQRWGSCDAAGRITLHWALLQLPPALIDLVLAHELTHLRTAGHGARFRQSMRALLIDLPERERHFAEVEKDLWRGAVG